MTHEEQIDAIKAVHNIAVKSGAIMSDEDADFMESNMKAMAEIRNARRQQFIDDIADAVVRKMNAANKVTP